MVLVFVFRSGRGVAVVVVFAVVVDFCFCFVKGSVAKNKTRKTPSSDGPSCSVIIRLHGIYLNSTPNGQRSQMHR